MRPNLFLGLPAPTVLLILSSLIDLTQGEFPSLPTPTKTLEYRVLNVISYAPQPTPPPPTNIFQYRASRHKRQTNETNANTICGYVGGDPLLPATCSLGSHCVLDSEHKVMGCCPNGAAQCTTGVFTGCVDFNSGPQTVMNPYVYTCSNGDVCYQNAFENGFSQYGCGSKTNMGTTVAAVATGTGAKPAGSNPSQEGGRLDIPSMNVNFTAKPATVATPITISNLRSFSTSTSSTGGSSSSTSTESSSSSASTSSAATTSATPQPTPAPPSATPSPSSSTTGALPGTGSSSTDPSMTQTNKPDQTGVIVGGTISGVAGLVAVVAAAIFLLQRRARNKRTGPGLNGDSTYISIDKQRSANPHASPMSHGPAFKPINGDQYGYNGYNGGTRSPPGGYAYPGQHPALYDAGGPGAHPTMSGGAGGSSFPTAAVAGGAAAAGAAGAYYAHGYTDDPYDGSVGAPRVGETEHLPLTAGALANVGSPHDELNDFSTGFHRALSRIGEEETDDDSRADVTIGRPAVGERTMTGNGTTTVSPNDIVSPLDDNASRPIWQQQRRRSSNTMYF